MNCLEQANDIYWSYIKLNGTKVSGEEDTYNAANWQWDKAQELKDAKEDTCFKQYGK